MEGKLPNTICSLEDLFRQAVFCIPQYQRAYSWEKDPHLSTFLTDLRQQVDVSRQSTRNDYFLGTLLLHHQLRESQFHILDIVDGQQRLTTSVLFVASALRSIEQGGADLEPAYANFRTIFLEDLQTQCRKFHTIREDEPFFQSLITQGFGAPGKTISSHRIQEAFNYFKANVGATEWGPLLTVLSKARVMVYTVTTSSEATQIFELQNDRGKRLTELESLKSFLMHAIYLYAKSPDDKLVVIQEQFATIFRLVEELEGLKGSPEEDAILRYYCVAFMDWTTTDDWRYPKPLVKKKLSALAGDPKTVISWIESFVVGLVLAFEAVKAMFGERDQRPAFSHLFVLGRLAPFWPLLIKMWNHDVSPKKTSFDRVCQMMEIYAFRGYAISNIRADSGQSHLYGAAKTFKGNFAELIKGLKSMCEWYNISTRFNEGLNDPKLYETNRDDALYFLWRYENHLRSKTGQKQPLSSWSEFSAPRDVASRFSIEHILSQEDPTSSEEIEWEKGDRRRYSEVALHRLGNLVIDTTSPNAAKGRKVFGGKLLHYEGKSIFLSQRELDEFCTEKDPEGNWLWEAKAIKKRHQALIDFAKSEWDPENVLI